ncbi:MAG: hypothetical protein ACD_63C00168G0002 [uncultured bacterium]|nr:MAG: hypothetical protein ACD_63C00168G0002 [uncultured bacterium]
MQKQLLKLALVNKISTTEQLENLKRRFAKKHGKPCPTNMELLRSYRELVQAKKLDKSEQLLRLLKTRDIRTLSGVAVVAVMTKPYKCPGKCLFCPTEIDVPKSYLSNEPAVMRAILCKYDPARQVKMRLRALSETGHNTDKVELIVMGGTFSALPKRYQRWFIKQCFESLNNNNYNTLAEAQKANEKAKHRCIGLTLETRPDFIDKKEIARFRELGATRIELGVQTVFDDVLKKNKRGHDVKETIKATKLLKDAGFKINYHMMPGLPGSSFKKDIAMFSELFKNQNFQPDMLKIYPCVITKNSKLYKLWRQKKYRPIDSKNLSKLLIKVKRNIPRYVRITRLIRDIPSTSIVAGSKISNLRQLIAKQNVNCKCIRCRQAKKDIRFKSKNLKFFIKKYKASESTEYFLSFEDKTRKILFAFLRLRITENQFLEEIKNAAIIREVHTYGEIVPISKKNKKAVQHLGLGKKLMKQSEKIAKKHGFRKIAVISGIGARRYYRKLGYKLKGTYMTKKI